MIDSEEYRNAEEIVEIPKNEFREFTEYQPQRRPRYRKKRKRKIGRILISFACCVAIVGTGCYVGANHLDVNSVFTSVYETVANQTAEATSVSTLSSVSGKEMTPTELYAENVGACVGITVSNVSTNVFGQASTTASSGSGFVITSDGYVVTNYHVIADAADSTSLTIDVSFYDGSSYPATLVGYEEDNDVAVLKISGFNFQNISLGDSSELEVGETIYAIGNPLGELTFSLTDGLVSALDRLVSTSETVTMNMFQTNTAINPGNSGGPLFNASGDVIGIATAKYSSSSAGTTVEGLGFAIPINDVVNILADLMEYGYVTGKPYLGVQVTNAQTYGATAGAAVSYVADGSAAESAGLQVGDIIVALDDTSIDTASALTAAITAYSAGDSATLTINRDGSTKTLTVVFDEKNAESEAANQLVVEQETQQTMPQIPNARP
ncbi:S1C family serine protease [Chakrabartyella piscis]|uniref:S1C family serine protease n=1 Tax=Chakrabartyella piscis TaxID=2918914 RepID=UPI002958806C|nr:trypsin-like peptidase domain-containing protein [Chakrabartyella piscis]